MKGFLRWLWHYLVFFGRPGRLYNDAMRAHRRGDKDTALRLVDEWLSLYGRDAK